MAVRLQAATLTVSNTADSGPGTLRAALAAAANGDTVDATGVAGTITLTTGQLSVSNSVTILGPGPGTLTVSGNSNSRVFQITPTATVTLNSLVLASGSVSNDSGGAILNSGQLTALNCLFTNNLSRGGTGQTPGAGSAGGPGGGGAGMGGAIFSEGAVLTLSNCVFSQNRALGGQGGTGNENGFNASDPGGAGGGPHGGLGGVLSVGGPGGYGGGGGGGAGVFNGTGYAGGAGGLGGGGGGGGSHGAGTGGIGGAGGRYAGNGGPALYSVTGGGGGGAGLGGAVFANTGAVTVANCTFSSNLATNGLGGYGSYGAGDGGPGQGVGGAVFVAGASLLLLDNVFSGNAASSFAPNIGEFNVQYVTVTNDSGPGSLRAALASAANGDTVDATGVSGTITLTNGQLSVSNSVTILGPGAGTLTVSGNTASRVFEVTGTNVAIRGLTIADGQGAVCGPGIKTGGPTGSVVTVSDCVLTNNSTTLDGAGLYNDPGVKLTVSNCTVCGNHASGNGGGICNDNGTMTVIASAFSGNTAGFGGGIVNNGQSGSASLDIIASTLNSNSAYTGGGILNYGHSGSAALTLNTCTLSGNSAGSGGGGGLCNNGYYGNAPVTIHACTLSSNSAPAFAGGIYSDGSGGSATLEIGDTILNAGAQGPNLLCGATTVLSDGYNLSSDDAGGLLTNATDHLGTDPLLGPLQDNGGPTWTHAPLTDSPAIDQGKSDAIPALVRATDQRGKARISDWPTVANADGGDGSDIGAFEAQYTPAAPSGLSVAYTFTTLAGKSWWGSADGVGDQAQFSYPDGIAVDSTGNLYVADSGNCTIRKITPAGVVSTLAGLAGMLGGSADGLGSNARFSGPGGITVDSAGNLFVADTGNSTIRKITPAGLVSTIAGLARNEGSADGTGSNARFYSPTGITVDSAGNLFVADTANNTIRMITPVGTNWVVSTLAGLAQFDAEGYPIGGANDGTNSDARFYSPEGITVDSAGNLFVADGNNNTIRKLSPAGTNWV